MTVEQYKRDIKFKSPSRSHISMPDSAQSKGKKTQSMVSHMSYPSASQSQGGDIRIKRVAGNTHINMNDHGHGN